MTVDHSTGSGSDTVGPPFHVSLPPQAPRQPGQEVIEVTFADGRTEHVGMHEYTRIYAVPGLYEEIVQRRLHCRSPEQVATMLAAAIRERGWAPEQVRVLDFAAGNGVSGEALAARGLRPVGAIDILAEARTAARRDRPGLYELYLVGDAVAPRPARHQGDPGSRPERPDLHRCRPGRPRPRRRVHGRAEPSGRRGLRRLHARLGKLRPRRRRAREADRRARARWSSPGARSPALPTPPHHDRRGAQVGGGRRPLVRDRRRMRRPAGACAGRPSGLSPSPS